MSARRDDLVAAPQSVQLVAGRQTVNLTLTDAAPLTGRVLALDDSPLSGVVIQARAAPESTKPQPVTPASSHAASTQFTTISDATGRFRLTDVPPGRYTLHAQVAGGSADFGRVLTVEENRQLSGLEFRLARFKEGRWRNYTQLDGLPDDQVLCLYQAADGALWCGTTRGVARFDGEKFTTLTHERRAAR